MPGMNDVSFKRKLYFKSENAISGFLSRFSEYITSPNEKPKDFSVLGNGGVYKVLTPEHTPAGTLYPLNFYMTSKVFRSYVQPMCDYKRFNDAYRYIFVENKKIPGECPNHDCTNCSDRGRCRLQRRDYDDCVSHDYICYTKRLPCGYPVHMPPVKTTSGVRFGW